MCYTPLELHSQGTASARWQYSEIGQVSSTPIEFGVQANSTRGQAVRDPYCDPSKPVVLSGPFDCLSDIELSVNGRSAKVKSSPVQTFHENIPALLLDADCASEPCTPLCASGSFRTHQNRADVLTSQVKPLFDVVVSMGIA